ncbi:tyrosine-type recombinase/integrase [Colwellia sp. RE-S-Sl-9]
MASFTITKRAKVNGDFSYRCAIVVKKNSAIIHRESKTFRKKELARTYGKRRIEEIENNELGIRKTVSLSTLLDLYIEDIHLWDKTGRTKRYVIQMLRDCEIAKIQSNRLKTSDLIQHCKLRLNAGAKPATIYHDVCYLRAVMKKAQPVFDIDANEIIFNEAIPTLIDMGLIGKSDRRTRRPTLIELDKLKEGLALRQNQKPNGNVRIPYLDILEFSILTCMRIGEVCKLKWVDLNEEHKTIIVRDRKDPRKKEGNHMIAPLLGGSFDIVIKQNKANELIFPYNSRSVTAGFQRVRNELGIEDLRYHDLRREGASRLFEQGYSIEEVAQVTGHRNLNVLWQVYTQLFPHKLHYKFK